MDGSSHGADLGKNFSTQTMFVRHIFLLETLSLPQVRTNTTSSWNTETAATRNTCTPDINIAPNY